MKIFKTILRHIMISFLIYLCVATTLTHIPVKFERNNAEGLDFNVLDINSFKTITANETNFQTRDKKSIFIREIPSESDLTIVLIHGSGTESRYLLPLAQKIHQALNAHIILPDLRGHGQSTLGKAGDVDYLGQYEDDLNDLYYYVLDKKPTAHVILGGHSSGGGLALKQAGRIDNPYHASLLIAPYLGYNAPTVKPQSGGWVQVSTRRYIGLSMLNRIGITAFNNKPVLFFNRPENLSDEFQLDSYSYRLNQSFSPSNYKQHLKNNQQPILVIVGNDDESFYAEKFEPVFKESAPQSQVHTLSNLKHLNITDDIRTVEIITRWLSTHLPKQK